MKNAFGKLRSQSFLDFAIAMAAVAAYLIIMFDAKGTLYVVLWNSLTETVYVLTGMFGILVTVCGWLIKASRVVVRFLTILLVSFFLMPNVLINASIIDHGLAIYAETGNPVHSVPMLQVLGVLLIFVFWMSCIRAPKVNAITATMIGTYLSLVFSFTRGIQ